MANVPWPSARIDMAVWDAVAKIEDKPLFQLLAERYGDGRPNRKVFVYAAGGYYYPGKDLEALQDEMKSYTERGYTVVKMKIGGAPLDRRPGADRGGAGRPRSRASRLAVDANGRFDLETAIEYARALAPYDLFWYEEAGDPLDYAAAGRAGQALSGEHGHRREPVFHAGCPEPDPLRRACVPDRDWLQFDCALSYGLVEYLRTLEMLRSYRLVARPAASPMAATRCPSISPPAWASAAMSPTPTCSSPTAASPTAPRWRTATS